MHRTDRVVREDSSYLRLGVANIGVRDVLGASAKRTNKNTWPNTPKRQKCIIQCHNNEFDIAFLHSSSMCSLTVYGRANPSTI
eukprot:6214089-Pleurochrysis_carterae.AAC.1